MNNEFRIKNMIADDVLYQLEQQNKETLKIYYANLEQENKQLKDRVDKAREYIKDLRQSTFTKYNSNEWNNCLSFNDDIKPLFEILGGNENE